MDAFKERPLIVYGLKRLWIYDRTQPKGKHAIVFNCILPGAIIGMKGSVHLVGMNRADNNGYRLEGDWDRTARNQGDMLYRLASMLQRTPGLNMLYIHRCGFLALGGPELAKEAAQIMTKMCAALRDVCGDMELAEVPEREVVLPSLKAIEAAEEAGALLPNAIFTNTG